MRPPTLRRPAGRSGRKPPTPPPGAVEKDNRGLWFTVCILTAVLTGDLAGQLMHALGSDLPDAVRTGAGAFVTALGLSLAIYYFFAGSHRRQ